MTGFLLATGREPVRVRHRLGRGARAGRLGRALLDRGAAGCGRAGRRRVLAIERGSAEEAVETAKSAHSLNPLSIAPLEAWASAEETRGSSPARASSTCRRSTSSPELDRWYELGLFDREVLGDEAAARGSSGGRSSSIRTTARPAWRLGGVHGLRR